MKSLTSVLAAEGYPLTMLAADMCRLLNIHENTLYRRIKAGRGVPPWRRLGAGKHIRYEWHRPAVERWLEQQKAAA